MSEFLRQAEDVLETAIDGYGDQDLVIVIGRQGGLRLMDAAGWTLPALTAEYGASAVFRVERRSGGTRVEGLCGAERCLLQRKAPVAQLWGMGMPGMASHPTAAPLAMLPRGTALGAA